MEFGVSLPSRGALARPDVILKIAKKAEELGYGSVFVSDHVVLPVSSGRSEYPYSPTKQIPGGAAQDYLEPLAMLSYLAHATRRVRLGTSVLVIPYRNPLVAAKILATIDVLSGGRVILGAGVGWLREEFDALATAPFEARGEVTDEYLTLMRLSWTSDPVTFSGRHYTVQEVHALPKPLQRGGIPIWIGGHTPGALRRAGALGDGWHPIGMRPPAMLWPQEYAAMVKQIHTVAESAGRDPHRIQLTFRAPMEVRSSSDKVLRGDRMMFQGTPAEVLADVRAYADVGVSHIVFDSTTLDLEAVLTNLARFAEEVRPKLSS
jgi:probable F420-dependent oxidoreductase